MMNLNFDRIEERMNKLTTSMKKTIEDKVLDKWTSEERLERIEEINESLLALYDMIQGFVDERTELEEAEEAYQKAKRERTNKLNKITNMFKPKKEEVKVSECDDKLISDKQVEYNERENELKQISYEVSGKINVLRQKLNRTELEEYELVSLINQLEEINKILE